MRRTAGVIGAAMLAGALGAQTPPRTVQQDFDAATALDAQPDSGAALAAWQALEKRVRPGSRSAALVAVRKGDALFRLNRIDEADAALRAGLAGLPANDPTLRPDRARAWLLIGTLTHNTLDYAGAAQAFRQAGELEDAPVGQLRAALAQAQVETFVDPAAAARTLDRADTLVASMGKVDGSVRGIVARRRAELLMNKGDLAGARTQALAAVRLMGGLTERTSLDDVAARGDAALAYILDGKPDAAREYMAMTGAGRLPKGDFRPAAQMAPPECGGEAELKPVDVAVVQFSIADDGSIARVEPVYAAGGGKVAIEFARAVRGWSWSPDELKTIPAFFRSNVRVEMRCSTAFARPSIGAGLADRLVAWLGENNVAAEPVEGDGDPARAGALRAALESANAKAPDSLETLVAAWRLSGNPAVPREERAALLSRAAGIAARRGAPVLARLALDLPARATMLVDEWKPGAFDRVAIALLADPAYAADPRARAAIQLIRTDYLPDRRSRDRDVIALLRPVADDARLGKDDPLRVGALMRLASAEQRQGNLAGARAAFAATGLSADQCAVLDATPRMTSMPGSDAFPREAMAWGFEGWAQVQFDVQADGRAAGVRTLLAYPAFTFSRAAADAFAGSRFEKTFRPDGAPGCGGMTRRIVFLLPGG